MPTSRSVLRTEAKKLYKEQVKGVPKKNRLPFADFFKQYKDIKAGKIKDVETPEDIDDFDFDNIINVNEISDDDTAPSEQITVEDKTDKESVNE